MNAAVIEEVVGDYVELKKSGSSLRGLSPFTNEKTPSFYVLPAKGIFKCFSSGKGGSLVTFLMELEKVNYPEALRMLARRYNIEVEEKAPAAVAEKGVGERRRSVKFGGEGDPASGGKRARSSDRSGSPSRPDASTGLFIGFVKNYCYLLFFRAHVLEEEIRKDQDCSAEH